MTELAPYQRIAKKIRDRIVAGVYAPGDRIPSTRELVESEGVAKATIDKAVRVLKEDQLIESRPGVGLVVRNHKRVDGPQDMFLRSTGLGQGIRLPTERSVLLWCGLNDLPEVVAEAMDLPAYSKAIQRFRRIERSGTPVCLCSSWYPPEFAEVAPRLLERRPIKQGTPAYLAEMLGTSVAHGVDIIEAQYAPVPGAAAEHLRVQRDEPLLHIQSRLTDPSGRLLEYGIYQYRVGAQVSYRYTLAESEGDVEVGYNRYPLL